MTDLIERLRALLAAVLSEYKIALPFDGGSNGRVLDAAGFVIADTANGPTQQLFIEAVNALPTLLDALEAKERDIIATRTALLLANERGLTGVAIAKDAPLNYLLDIPNHIGKENDRLWAKVELLAATVTRIANIAARLAEIARSVHIGDLERAEISALELELVKERL